MTRRLNLWKIVPIVIGLVFFVVPYAAYVFIIPPFYTAKSSPTDSTGKFIDIDPGNETIIWPLNKTLAEGTIIVRPDVNYTLKLTIKSMKHPQAALPMPINITVFAADAIVYQISLPNQTSFEIINLSLNGTFSRFPGVWRLGLEHPFEHGYDVYIRVVNVGSQIASVSFSFSGNVGYSESFTFLNFFLFIIGAIVLFGSLLQNLWSAYQKRVEEKVRKMAKTEEVT